MKHRDKTRRERYDEKKKDAKTYPISVATVNFLHDGNVGFLIRAAACFGAQRVHVIGSIPHPKTLKALSGTLNDYVQIEQHSNPQRFLEYAREQEYNLVCAELTDEATPLPDYTFDFNKPVCIVVGHEQTGIPADLIRHGDSVFIPMSGVGHCLNTSQTANVMLYEATKRFDAQNKFLEEWVNECYIHYP